MKRKFVDIAIQCWQHERNRLGKSQPAICLQADTEAIGLLIAAIDELIIEGAPSTRMLTLLPNARKKQCRTLQLTLSPEDGSLRQMSLTRQGETAKFEFTPDALARFRESVEHWKDGDEDFSIHPNRKKDVGTKDLASGEVWFWTTQTDP